MPQAGFLKRHCSFPLKVDQKLLTVINCRLLRIIIPKPKSDFSGFVSKAAELRLSSFKLLNKPNLVLRFYVFKKQKTKYEPQLVTLVVKIQVIVEIYLATESQAKYWIFSIGYSARDNIGNSILLRSVLDVFLVINSWKKSNNDWLKAGRVRETKIDIERKK